jgi:hypothetical protein
LADKLRREKARIREERKAAGQTGRPPKSEYQKELEKEIERTKALGFSANVKGNESVEVEAEESPAVDVLIVAFDMIQQRFFTPAGNPVPLRKEEKEAIRGPLNKVLEKYQVAMTPEMALGVALGGSVLTRYLLEQKFGKKKIQKKEQSK